MRMKHHLFLGFSSLLIVGLVGCLSDENMKLPFSGYLPEQLEDGWEISSPEMEGLDRDKIEQVYEEFFSEDLYPTAHSLLIVRHGRLVAEAYCRDRDDRENIHNLQSATKSITSILLGIAIDSGLVDSVETPVYQFIPEYFDSDIEKRAITLHHTLTMQTGLQFDNDEDTVDLFYYTGNTVEFVLHRDLVFSPGTSFYYHDGNPQLISGVIQSVSGESLEEFAVEKLFNPLGIEHFQWETPSDGRSFGAFGLWLRPRDMAKIGKLVVQDGEWNGDRIISAEWIEESSSLHVPLEQYGYYWWVYEEHSVFMAEGHGEQLIFVNQDYDLVIVMTADPYSSDAALSPGFRYLINDIVAAINR
jgi:CubicO group peptidase (beta-lactamase class C family)